MCKNCGLRDQKTEKIGPIARWTGLTHLIKFACGSVCYLPNVLLEYMSVIHCYAHLKASLLETRRLLEISINTYVRTDRLILLQSLGQIYQLISEESAGALVNYKSKTEVPFACKCATPKDKLLKIVLEVDRGKHICEKSVEFRSEAACPRNSKAINPTVNGCFTGLKKRDFSTVDKTKVNPIFKKGVETSTKPDKNGKDTLDSETSEGDDTHLDNNINDTSKADGEAGHNEDTTAHDSRQNLYSEGIQKPRMYTDILQPYSLDQKGFHTLQFPERFRHSDRNLPTAAPEKTELDLTLFPFAPTRQHLHPRPHTAPLPATVPQTREELRRRMRQQNWRIASMVHLQGVRHVPMAEAGLYLDEDDDVFRCYYCSLEVARGQWPLGEDPRTVHQRQSPECPVVNAHSPDTAHHGQAGRT
ncbi:hypothetical protein ACOMHN_014459 [Nucella lapillus]